MVEDIHSHLGRIAAAMVLGVSVQTVEHWRNGLVARAAVRRLIWLTWCLVFHPERLSSIGELVTWGRFRIERRPPTRPEDWSGWSI
jgi:hypothetical protein